MTMTIIERFFEGERVGPPLCSYGYELAAVGVAILAAGVSAYAQSESMSQQADAARYNKKANENAATLARQQADLAAEREGVKQKRLLATQHVAQAASGVVTTEGSPLIVAMESARQAQTDLDLIRYTGQSRGWAFETEAKLQGMYARNYSRAAVTGAGVSLLSSAASYGLYRYGRPAPTPTPTGSQIPL